MRTDPIASSPSHTLKRLLILVALAVSSNEPCRAQDILESPRTMSVDFDYLTTAANEIPQLNTIVANNRTRALWLLDDPIGKEYSVDHVDAANVASTNRFNPRRCMRVIMDTAAAARLGGVQIGGSEARLGRRRVGSSDDFASSGSSPSPLVGEGV